MKNQNKKPKQTPFNQYWIFGSIVFIFLILNIFSGSGSKGSDTTTPSKFFEYASNGDVEKIEIINKREVYVYLTRDAKITMLCILNRNNTFHWLPTELHRFIMGYFKTPGNPLWIYNEKTKKHYEKCKECAKKLVNFVDTHSCPHHIVIRKC